MVKNLPSNAGDVGSIPGGIIKDLTCQGANKPAHISTMEQHTTSGESVHCNKTMRLKILLVTTKSKCSQISKKNFFK